MTRTPLAIALAALLSTAALSQTSSTTHRTSTHQTSTAARRAAGTANPADNPPGVPKITGTPKPLYALRYVDTVVGTGDLAQPHKYYSVRYTGWLTDGTKFDSSYDHPGQAPISFPYGAHRVIPGWDTGFEGMHVGGKRRIYIPYQLAYGETGRPPVIPPKANLIFDMELVSMSDTAPADPAAPPAPTSQPAAQPQGPARPSTEPTDPTKPTSTSPPPTSNTPAPTTPTSPK